jgi:N-acetylneuraminic acid mutarotase
MTCHHLTWLCLAVLVVGSVAAADGLAWRTGAPMPIATGGHCAALVDGQVLVAGGNTWQHGQKRWLREVFAYDVAADHWREVGALPEPVGDATGIAGVDALYVIGGSDATTATKRCLRLRLHDGALLVDHLPDLPEPRVYAAGARVGSCLYVIGGATDPAKLGTATATVFALDLDQPASGWQTLAPLPGPARVVFTAAGCGGEVCVFGGCRLDDQGVVRNLADAYRYDPRTAQWQRLPDAPAANRAWTAVGDGGGHVLLCGGFTATEEACAGKGNDFGFTADVLRFDPAAGTYTLAGKLPVPTACAVPVRAGQEVLLLGGEPVKKQRGDWVWITTLAGH